LDIWPLRQILIIWSSRLCGLYGTLKFERHWDPLTLQRLVLDGLWGFPDPLGSPGLLLLVATAFNIISARPSKQPLMVRTFLKVYKELCSYFVSARKNKRHHNHFGFFGFVVQSYIVTWRSRDINFPIITVTREPGKSPSGSNAAAAVFFSFSLSLSRARALSPPSLSLSLTHTHSLHLALARARERSLFWHALTRSLLTRMRSLLTLIRSLLTNLALARVREHSLYDISVCGDVATSVVLFC